MTIQKHNADFATTARPAFYRLHNGEAAVLPFSDAEYEARLAGLRASMARMGVEAVVLTSMHNIAYFSGFLYYAFGRPYTQVVTPSRASRFRPVLMQASPGGAVLATTSPTRTRRATITGGRSCRLSVQAGLSDSRAII